MADRLEILRQLQAVDGELYRLRAEQRQKPLALERAKQQVAEQQAKAQAIDARLKTLQVQHKEKELLLSTSETNVKKLQLQLFQVKTNKEYTALQHEIEQSKADISLLEEEIIGFLDASDHTRQEHAAQLKDVTRQEEALRAEQTHVEAELAAIHEQVAKLDAKRQTIAPMLKAEDLAFYERVLVNREGLALVPLIGDSCGGCHMVQPPQVINETYLKARLVTCESCSRILYVDESAGEPMKGGDAGRASTAA